MRAVRSDGMTLRGLERTMKTTEIRVRPVIRHAVTRFTQEERAAGSECMGEFASEQYAEEVARALKEKHAPREFILVQETPGMTHPEVRYAYSQEEVDNFLSEPRTDIGYKVYSRVMPTLQY
jgi:hypothetical protein